MYDLHNLGWNSFQQLCLTITGEILGQTVESFLDSGDGGRDGAFTGNWRHIGQEDLTGAFVIQCKFTSRRNYSLKPSDVSDELEKARRLVAKGLCDSYVLLTNAGLSGTGAGRIKRCFKDAGVKHVVTFGSTWINRQISENKRLRMLVPRVYGLGDLSQILDERAYMQARTVLESLREDLAKVVVTDAYRRAAEALDKHSFVLLIGEPAAGKLRRQREGTRVCLREVIHRRVRMKRTMAGVEEAAVQDLPSMVPARWPGRGSTASL